MGVDRAVASAAEAQATAISRTSAGVKPRSAYWHPVCAQDRHTMERLATGNGLRIWGQLLAQASRLAGSWRVVSLACFAAGQVACCRPHRLFPSHYRFFVNSCCRCWSKTGPNPTDRARPGSKHHLATDANGTPLAAILTGANRHDVTQLLPLVKAIPPIAGRTGRPISKPWCIFADRAYDCDRRRRLLLADGIMTAIAKRGAPHGSGLGKVRWVVERTHAWIHAFRRLRVRFERRADIHEAFLSIACCIICWRTLKRSDFSF